MNQPSFKNPLSRDLPKVIRTGVWASYISAFMLIGIGLFWVLFPNAAEGSFSITADSDAAIRFSKITSIFKAVGDLLPPIFVLLAIRVHQFRLAGLFHMVTLILVIIPDMIIWGTYVPNAGVKDILQHLPFAIPIVIAAYCFLKPNIKINTMLIFIRFFLILYGLIAIGTGILAMTGPYDAAVEPMADNSHRFIAAIWASMALAFFYCVWNPSEVALFRFLMIALFIGGIVRSVSLIYYSPTPIIWAVILLELIPTPILWYVHSKYLNTI